MKILYIFLGLTIILSISRVSSASDHVGPLVGDKVYDFTLNDLDGKRVKLVDFRKDKTALVYFWASWCKDTKGTLPKIKAAYERFRQKNVAIIGVNTGVRDSVEMARNYREKYGLKFPLVFDKGSSVSNMYLVMGTPRFFVVNKKGKIVYSSGTFPENLDKMN